MVYKCKMCGGDLRLVEGNSTAQCEYCGSMQTVPSADNEKKMTLFSRANRLRSNCEFDKASGVYESIVADFPEEAEAYWGLVLCKYGIEYVDDPANGKKVPTCHRSSFESLLDDNDFEQTLENADTTARKVYRDEAKQIEEIRKGIIAVSSNEEPYDIFICYKETTENGDRTLDSVLAQDIYEALSDKGYRVFFSRITLEDKLGQEYEPYIFAALNSARVMLAIGTDYEYYNAVWVKNEWSRYLKLIAEDHSKHLIPCYKGIDAYDMPKEFAKLQAQDLGKLGAIQDLLRGIDKLIKTPATAIVPAQAGADIAQLLTMGSEALGQGDWDVANNRFDLVLLINPKCAEAHLGKLMAERKCKEQRDLTKSKKRLESSGSYREAVKYADDALKQELEGYSHKTRMRHFRKIMLAVFATVIVSLVGVLIVFRFNMNWNSVIVEFYSDPITYAQSTYDQLSTWSWLRKPDECTQYLLQKEIPGSYPMALNATAVTIPDYVTEIGPNTFKGCTNLISITIPDSVVSIGDSAFKGCTNLTDITIPDSVTSIGDSPFSECSSLKSITLSNSITGIANLKLDDLPLENLILGSGITSIDGSIFRNLSSLISITIPDSVVSIGDSAFRGCTNLTSITIPNSVTSIGHSAFKGCVNLTSITIPNSVTGIGDSMFNGCTNLTSIIIPNSVTDIGDYVFAGCTNLTSIIIPNSVTNIGDSVFNGCTNLTSITIPSSVTNIGHSAFIGSDNLKNVYYTGTEEQWGKIKFHAGNKSLLNAQIRYNYQK